MTTERLPDELVVFRICAPSMDGDETGLPSYKCFELSSDDKAAKPPALTVWDSQRTTPQQCVAIRGVKPKAGSMVVKITVGHIRKARSDPPDAALPHADVIRSPLTLPAPGADGHCSVLHLKRPDNYSGPKFKTLLRALAKSARAEPIG